MIRKTRLYTPGPTPLLPAAQFAMAAADIHHRTAEFRALFQKVLAQLKVFIGTKNDVLLLACSGTGAMEASVSNLTSPGDKVLVLTAGKFGERWVDLAKAFGCQPDVVKAPYGETFDLAAVRAALKPEQKAGVPTDRSSSVGWKAIYMQATETSTAVRHDVEAIAKLRDQVAPNTLLVVDGITGLGTTHFDVDGWGVDVLIGGSQKAVMIPPGLAYLSVSERAWAAMETAKNPRYYFDLRKERKNAVKGESAYTPAVALVAGLGAALDYIAGQAGGDLEKGRDALIDNAQVNAAATRAGLVALGFTLFAPKAPAAAATAVAVPEGMDSTLVVKALKAKFALVVANGQGEMQGKIFRVAHLGFFDYLDTVALLGAMEHIAKDTLELPVIYGQAVAAAQEVYAKAASSS
jgi:aspartate aminotransferase-like enzyme